MYTLLLICHVVMTIAMVVVVLLQSGKGGGLGAGFGGGGGANTLFGSSGGSDFFTKLTMGLAAALAVTSIGLTAINNHSLKTSIFDQSKSVPSTPASPANPAAPAPAPANPAAAPEAPVAPVQQK
jgi:preprotein translocase subunit SecG